MRRAAAPPLLALAALAATLLVAGCGSSKPAYCSDLSNLEASVKALGDVNVVQNGVGALTTALDKVKTNAQAFASSAKGALQPQANALESSVQAVGTSLTQLTSSSTRTTAIANLPSQVSAVTTNLDTLVSDAKCS